ncbi:lysylphosphatidylglycerol synthase transmembrane domain-containing protein [Aquicella lusitana]|uniref:Uncharacterized membrane protein YbhN (UPF0104 family) n=1 Tax=Aquicella lusitana TaxID=254246 RepID=A0A370GWW3_9COXI|nr:lysylphosphatidylglycerol synthase transmembrane domain-containing protein [Aquicella lusitana]RDI48142.1 uncharacterized membrane protein YbhN (UPF0104 family) [Aquicella lusitana]VVC72842.1 hypothetical protein AQULUS_05660 [Aquicella lusitana]
MKILKLLICFTVSGVCLLLIFRKVDVNEVSHLLSNISYIWLLIGTIIGVLKMWMTGFRWRYLVPLRNRLTAMHSFYFYSIGTMINMVLPFRIGDILRARLIAETLKIPNTNVLGTIAREHIMDLVLLCSLLLGCLTIYSYRLPSQVISTVNTFLTIVAVVFGAAFLLKKNNFLMAKLKKLNSLTLPKPLLFFSGMLTNFYSGFFQLGDLKNITKMFGMSVCIWIAQGFWIYTLLCSLGIAGSYQLGVEATVALMIMMGIAVMIPASPGYIGTFHLMVILGLTQMGVPKSVSLSYAILAHAHAVGVAVLMGIYSLWKGNIKLSFYFNLTDKSAAIQEVL